MSNIIEITDDSKLVEILATGTIYVNDGGGGGGGGANLAYTASPTQGIVTSDSGTDATIPAGSAINASLMLPADKAKLDGVASGATANSTDAQLRDRTTHTGTQAISTITGLQTALDGKQATGDYATNTALTDGLATKANVSHIHVIDDVTGLQTALNAKQATLVSGTNIKTINTQSILGSGDITIGGSATWGSITGTLSTQTDLQTVLNTKLESSAIANFETSTQLNARDTANRTRANHTGTQAINTITGLQTALDGKQPTGDYATNTALTSGLATKENTITAGTAAQYYRGDKTFQPLDKSAVGLGNVDNTSDLNKPISTATQTALNAKQNTPIEVTGVSVTTSNWILSGGIYYKDITNVNITASTSVTVIPANATIAIVEEAVLLPLTESSSGSVRIWAKNVPTSAFTVSLIIGGVV